MADTWSLKGSVLVACNCDWGCPCNFNARPTKGKCEGGWTWHVDRGRYADVPLDGLNFSVYVNWPGAIHEGNGEALILVDERADLELVLAADLEEQRDLGESMGGDLRIHDGRPMADGGRQINRRSCILRSALSRAKLPI